MTDKKKTFKASVKEQTARRRQQGATLLKAALRRGEQSPQVSLARRLLLNGVGYQNCGHG